MARRSSLQACRRAAAPSQPGASSWLASAVAGPPNGEPSGSAAGSAGHSVRIRALMKAW
jgi:hypothetical protein